MIADGLEADELSASYGSSASRGRNLVVDGRTFHVRLALVDFCLPRMPDLVGQSQLGVTTSRLGVTTLRLA